MTFERYTAIRTIAAEMIAHGSGDDLNRVLDLFACDAGYATPKVDVRGVVFQDLLLGVAGLMLSVIVFSLANVNERLVRIEAKLDSQGKSMGSENQRAE